tara:strand:+ start:12904 stop:13578 length:675 start_codon:yes stop_codon:yes gene_type:complete
MNFIKTICQGEKTGAFVHRQFVRLGKGQYDRFLVKLKKGKNLSVKTSFDWSNELFRLVAFNIEEDAEVSGKIITNYDFESEIDAVNFSKRGKLYTAELKKAMSPKEMQELFEKFKMHYLLLSVKGSNYKLKCKSSLPKPGGKLKDNFCSASFPLEFAEEFDFDFGKDYKQAVIIHKLDIQELIVPEDCKDDFRKAREVAVRKGKLIREIDLDGSVISREYSLEV